MGLACLLLLLTLVQRCHSQQDEVPSASCAGLRSSAPGCDKGLSMLARRHRVTKKDLLERVTLTTSTHTLYYAPDFPDVGDMTKVTTEEVPLKQEGVQNVRDLRRKHFPYLRGDAIRSGGLAGLACYKDFVQHRRAG